MEKKTNILGLDVFQTAAVKRGYQNVKRLITQRNKMAEKIQEIQGQIDALNEQINDSDVYTLKLTEKVLGFSISSEECMYYLEHPEEFAEYKQAHTTGEGETAEEPTEE